MTNRKHSALLLVFVAGLAACDRLVLPTAPTPTVPPPFGPVASPANGGELIKGTVSDSALRPLAGARVEILDGPQPGLAAILKR